MGVNNSPAMNLPIPQVGSESGPQYAQDVNNCLILVDQHNHSPGFGVQISPNGLNINSDLTFNANNLITVRSVRFSPQTATLSTPADVGCLYEVTNDLYYNDGLGNQIRLTQAGGIVGTSGSIANLVAPASATYVSLTQTIVFQSDTNTAANLDAGFIVLRTAAANSPGLTLTVPASISSDYSIALPLLPASTLPVSLDSAGNMSTGQIGTAGIANAAIGTAQLQNSSVTTPILADASVTAAKIAPGALASVSVPSGVVSMYGGTTAPTGYLLCDGTSYLRTDFTDLYTAIGNAFGSADGTHFNVPDMRGQFPRGVDAGAGRDPDTSSRTAMNAGGNTGDNVGSVQANALLDHNHLQDGKIFSGSGIQTGAGIGFAFTVETGLITGQPVSTENRPLNAYFNFIIKT